MDSSFISADFGNVPHLTSSYLGTHVLATVYFSMQHVPLIGIMYH